MATKELTTGKPLKLIFCFMLPIFFGNLFQQLYNLVDALIVGRVLGIKALAAVGSGGPLIFLVISFIFASTQGFTVVTGQKFGARDYTLVKKSIAASFLLSLLLTLILTLISAPFAYKMLFLLRTPLDIINPASQYLVIMFAGIFAIVFYNLAANILRALGDSKTPLYFLIFASFLNVFLDLLFIIKFNMGIRGTAWATVISQFVSTILCISFMYLKFPILRLKRSDWQFDLCFLYEHLRVGIPMGFQMSVLSLGIIALQFVLNSLGSIAVAAYTTAMRTDQLFSQVFLALGATMAAYTAQNFGAGKMARIKEGAKSALLITAVTSVISVVILMVYAEQITALFMDVPNDEVIRLSALYIRIIVVFFIFLGALLVYRNILQGMGNVVAPLMSGIAELVARTVCAFVLGKYFGYLGICFATPAAWFMGAIVLYFGYKMSLLKNISTKKNKLCR